MSVISNSEEDSDDFNSEEDSDDFSSSDEKLSSSWSDDDDSEIIGMVCENPFMNQFKDGINTDKICTCGRIGDCFLECGVCDGKCCIFCVPKHVEFDMCQKCYQETCEEEEKIRIENKCQECDKHWTHAGPCSCHPNNSRFKLCDKHTMKCRYIFKPQNNTPLCRKWVQTQTTTSKCNNVICFRNGTGLCPDHNLQCQYCRDDVVYHSEKRVTHLTCILCGSKSCRRAACSGKEFPLYNIHRDYPLICKRHNFDDKFDQVGTIPTYLDLPRCKYCQGQCMVKCFVDGCSDMVCYNLKCSGMGKPKRIEGGEKIQAFCWRHTQSCDMCHRKSKTDWLTVPQPLRFVKQGVYVGYPRLCDKCYSVIAAEFREMCLVFNRLQFKPPRGVQSLILMEISKNR